MWPYKLYIISHKYFTLFRRLMQVEHRYLEWLNCKPLQLMTPTTFISPHTPSPLNKKLFGWYKKKMEIINWNEFSFSFGYIEELNHLELLFNFILLILFIFPSFVTTLKSKHSDMTTRANDCQYQKIKRTHILAILGK